jgi:flagellar biosynthesis/type III secretory pathway protein FliH
MPLPPADDGTDDPGRPAEEPGRRVPDGEPLDIPLTSPEDAADALAGLRDQIRAAREAAERLAAEQGASASRTGASDGGAGDAWARDAGSRVPPQGWASPHDDGRSVHEELQALLAVLHALRHLIPADLQQQISDLVRQVLLLLRAILDRIIDRLDPEPVAHGEPEIEDIPIA